MPLFRTSPPDGPPKYLVVYFIPFDARSRSVLLGDHRKSGLWLPPGGHVEDSEDPWAAVTRETAEELGLVARPHPRVGRGPLFLSVTPPGDRKATPGTTTRRCGGSPTS